MILSRRIPVLCEHLKQSLRRTLTSETTTDGSDARNSSISKPDTGRNLRKIVFFTISFQNLNTFLWFEFVYCNFF